MLWSGFSIRDIYDNDICSYKFVYRFTYKMNNNWLEGQFVCKNVINLSQRQLTKSENSLPSIGLKFVPTPNRIDKVRGFWERT